MHLSSSLVDIEILDSGPRHFYLAEGVGSFALAFYNCLKLIRDCMSQNCPKIMLIMVFNFNCLVFYVLELVGHTKEALYLTTNFHF